jgi:hypothetical protein
MALPQEVAVDCVHIGERKRGGKTWSIFGMMGYLIAEID